MCKSPLMIICRCMLVYVDRGLSDRLERGERARRAELRSCVDSTCRLTAQWVRIVPGAGG